MTTPQDDPYARQYNPDPMQYGQVPGAYGQAPGQYGQAPAGYGQDASGYGQAPGQYGQAPQGMGPGFAMPSAPYYQQSRSLATVARTRGMRQIIIGAIVFAVGLVITIATYASASATGGTYFVAYGPMIVGVVTLVRGIVALGRSRNLN